MTLKAFFGPPVFDGAIRHGATAVLVEGERVVALVRPGQVPDDAELVQLKGDLIAPGFVDVQVNGGGGLMFNDTPTIEAIETICRTHARFGTTAVMITYVTNARGPTRAAIEIARQAINRNIPGCIGLHLEGPHFAITRKGAHPAQFIRPMDEADVDVLLQAGIDNLMITLAVEAATPAQMRRLVEGGVIVSLGHSDSDFDSAEAAIAAGATGATHLFNAMSQLSGRAPNLVGAALAAPALWCGIIADDIHVHRASLGIAIRAKRKPGRIFLVTDAVGPFGADGERFIQNGQSITRHNGRITLADGTLAGADIDMASSVRNLVQLVGIDLHEALRMASLYPAMFLGIDQHYGRLGPGTRADFVTLDTAIAVRDVVIGGQRQQFR